MDNCHRRNTMPCSRAELTDCEKQSNREPTAGLRRLAVAFLSIVTSTASAGEFESKNYDYPALIKVYSVTPNNLQSISLDCKLDARKALTCTEDTFLLVKMAGETNVCRITKLTTSEKFVLQNDGSWTATTLVPSCNAIQIGELSKQLRPKASDSEAYEWQYRISTVKTGNSKAASSCGDSRDDAANPPVVYKMVDYWDKGVKMDCEYILDF